MSDLKPEFESWVFEASAQPEPSKSDEALPDGYFKDQFGNFRYGPDALARARAATFDECEAIARDEARMWGAEAGSSALAAADRIAALKRGPVAGESGK